MDWGILATDFKTDVDLHYEWSPYESKKTMNILAPQTSRTTTYSPTSVQDITYAPQYIIGSPEASALTKKEGASAQPSIFVSPSQIVSPTQTDVYGKEYSKEETPDTGGGIFSGVTGMFAIGLLAVGGIFALSIVMKAPKSKAGLVKKGVGKIL
jgi:hypothetical protein